MTDQTNSMEPEQAADLAALTAGAGGDSPAQAAPQAAPQDAAPSAAALQMAALAVSLAKPLICYAVPALQGAPDQLWDPIPEGIAAVLDLHGANAEWMQNPYARLALSCAPLAAYGAMAAMKDKPKDAPKIKAPEPAPGQPSAGVTFGDPLPVPEPTA